MNNDNYRSKNYNDDKTCKNKNKCNLLGQYTSLSYTAITHIDT